ncbi:MAG: tRNA pseudouridine(38-40) synthase TruA [Anaerolineae bacterium]|nr:tRNA pseudouridine(38-40) synthase TruA [Anaerolineae bacterium]
MHVKATVCYDGTGYAGYQRQLNVPTIQADIEHTLTKLTGEAIRITAAGRTDAGVHAKGQVIAFSTGWRHTLTQLHNGLNALLPDQIAVLDMEQVPETFHPRFDAIRRHYRYTLYRAEVRNPLLSRYSVHCRRELDLAAMQQAAEFLVGRHDFSAFGSPPQGTNAIREVFSAHWRQENGILTFDIEANAFLQRMVRMVVGTNLRVGYGKISPANFHQTLQLADRSGAGPAAAPQGLCLMSVKYTA